MIELILKIVFLTVSWSLGWKVIISEGMLLEKLGRYAENKIKEGNKIGDVIFCEWCIPNLHGVLFVLPLAFALGILPFELNWKYLFMYPFCLGASSFITGMLWQIHLLVKSKIEFNESGRIYFEQSAEYYYNLNKNNDEKK